MSPIHSLYIAIALTLGQTDVVVRDAKGHFPAATASKVGSGSGIAFGGKWVLTNRHVVEDSPTVQFDGFNVFLGPDFATQHRRARVVKICDNYDLALLELEKEAITPTIAVYDGLAPLTTKVTAFGFPLGARFGVALTATGGQVSRHPVSRNTTDSPDEAHIKSSIWHDAIIASGSSGGPLLSESGVLVGLNFASLGKDSKYAFAVPSTAIATFLRECGTTDGVNFVKSASDESRDTKAQVVYIEILSNSSGAKEEPASGMLAEIQSQILTHITSALPNLSDSQLSALADGDLAPAFPRTPPAHIKAGKLARIAGSMTVIQISSRGMLTEIDGVRCLILLPDGKSAELSAKFGDKIIFNVPIDALYLVGEATKYITVAGKTAHYFPLLPLAGTIDSSQLKTLVDQEKSNRRQAILKAEAEARAARERKAKEQRERLIQRNLEKLRHTFNDATGKFTVDAICVSATDESVTLVRMSDKRRIDVKRASLSHADNEWITANRSWIKLYGKDLDAHITESE